MENENENEYQYLPDMLAESLANDRRYLDTLQQGSEEHIAASKAFNETYKVWAESKKIEIEANQRNEQLVMEAELEKAKLEQQKKHHFIDTAVNIGLGVLGVVVPAGIYAVWMKKGFKFEETGTYTSNTFKNFFKTLKPTKF